jgi:predicted ribosomally synthesized peptide with nif11-like leader
MSAGQIEQFYGRVSKDPAMFNQLVDGTQTPDEFIDKAVALGTQAGFTFSRDEADVWVKKQIEAKASGELSDLQLESVAGGKGGAQIITSVGNAVTNTAANAWTSAVNIIGTPVANWLSSW